MLLIDGHNLIGRTPGLSLAREEASREDVLRRVAAVKGSGGQRVVVVFDGNRPGSAKEQGFGGIRVVYSPAGSSADDEILRRTGGGNTRTVTVVTSDRRLAQRARGLGARSETCEDFWARLHKRRQSSGAAAAQPAVLDEDVEEWLRVFGDESSSQGDGHKM